MNLWTSNTSKPIKTNNSSEYLNTQKEFTKWSGSSFLILHQADMCMYISHSSFRGKRHICIKSKNKRKPTCFFLFLLFLHFLIIPIILHRKHKLVISVHFKVKHHLDYTSNIAFTSRLVLPSRLLTTELEREPENLSPNEHHLHPLKHTFINGA